MVIRNSLPQNFITSLGSVYQDMQDTANWISGINATITADTTIFKEGVKGVKAQATDANTIYRVDKVIDDDLSNDESFTFCFYVHDITEMVLLTIYLAEVAWNKWFNIDLSALYLMQGWNYIKVNKSSFNSTGSPNWANHITKVRFAVTPVAGKACPVTLGAVYKNEKSIPKVCITFDDGYKSAIDTAYPIMMAAGIKGTCYVIKDIVLSSDANYMRKESLDALYSAGWDIANHTTSHANLTTLNANQQYSAIKGCQDWLFETGYTRSYKHLAYPVGAFNDVTLGQTALAGVLTARTIIYGFQRMPAENLLTLKIATAGANMDATIKLIYEAIKAGKSCMIMLHNIGSSGTNLTPTEDFQKLISFLAGLKVDCVTISEWYEQLTHPRKRVDRI